MVRHQASPRAFSEGRWEGPCVEVFDFEKPLNAMNVLPVNSAEQRPQRLLWVGGLRRRDFTKPFKADAGSIGSRTTFPSRKKNLTRSPVFNPRCLRTDSGMVTWPLPVTVDCILLARFIALTLEKPLREETVDGRPVIAPACRRNCCLLSLDIAASLTT